MNNLSILITILIILLLILISLFVYAIFMPHYTIQPAGCISTRWGCCSDGMTAKEDQMGTNCAAYGVKEIRGVVMPSEDLQKPVMPLHAEHRPAMEVQPAMQELRQPTMEVQPSMQELRQPAQELRQPAQTLRQPAQELRQPTQMQRLK